MKITDLDLMFTGWQALPQRCLWVDLFCDFHSALHAHTEGWKGLRTVRATQLLRFAGPASTRPAHGQHTHTHTCTLTARPPSSPACTSNAGRVLSVTWRARIVLWLTESQGLRQGWVQGVLRMRARAPRPLAGRVGLN